MKVKLFDKEQNKDIEVEDAALPQMLSGERFSVYPDQKFEFEDQSGQRKIVPSEQLFDAIDSGYKYIDSSKLEREKALQSAEEQPLLAAGVAGLSGLTLGASDYALKESGLFSEDELSALREANPTISTVSEIVGGVAPAFVTGGSSLGARALTAAPAGIAMRLGEKAAASTLVGKALSKTTSEVAKQAIKVGVGSAVEGSLFGAGRLLSEDALGDAEFNAENLLSYAGMGALTGGLVGGTVAGGAAFGSKAMKAGRDKLRELETKYIKKNFDDEVAKSIESKILKTDAVEDIAEKSGTTIDDLQSKYDESIEIEKNEALLKASQELGVPITPGMEAGGIFKELEASLAKSKTVGGYLTSKEIQKTYDGIESVGNSFLKTAKEIDPVEVGITSKSGIVAKIEDEMMPARLIYEDIKPKLEGTKINPSLRKRFKTELGKDFYAKVASDGESWLKKLERSDTIDDIRKLRSMVGAEKSSFGIKPIEKEFLGKLYDRLSTVRDNAIKYGFPEKEAADILDNLKLADTMWREDHKKFEFLHDQFGFRSESMSELLDNFKNNITDEAVSKKILSLHDAKQAKQFQAAFPELYDMARSARLAEIRNKSLHEGVFSPKKFKKQIENLSDTQLDLLFPNVKNPKQVRDSLEVIIDNLPPNPNPSGTALELAMQNIMSLPYQLSELARYKAYKMGSKAFNERIKNFGGVPKESLGIDSIIKESTEDAATKAPVLEKIEKASNKGKVSISDAVDSYLKLAKTGARAGAKGLEKYITGKTLSDEDYKKAEEKAIQYSTNPDQIIENFSKNNQQMLKSAPKTTQALSDAMVRATQFLASKAPKIKPSVFDDNTPSRSEVLKFKNYADAVENPIEAINTIAKGYITPEAVEAMQVVYPKMYQSLKDEFAQRIPEFKKLSEKQKGDLSRLLELEDRPAFSARGFQTLQGVSSQGVQKDLANNQPNRSKVPVSAAKNIGQSGRMQSGLDKVLNRS